MIRKEVMDCFEVFISDTIARGHLLGYHRLRFTVSPDEFEHLISVINRPLNLPKEIKILSTLNKVVVDAEYYAGIKVEFIRGSK